MKCVKCKNKAIYKDPTYCKDHFIHHIESTIKKTIRKYKLIDKKDKLFVAVSGGKDSLTVLYNLREYNPTAIAIDEGIKGYREHTIKDLRAFCKAHKIRLQIISIKKEFGFTLDQILKKIRVKPCTVCGTLRRYLLNLHARKLGATKLATGHNLDDEAQAVLMNLFRNQLWISARLGPITEIIKDKRFIPRIKPLYFLSEKEVTAYTLLKNFNVRYVECPYTHESYRGAIQDILNDYELKHPGTKRNIIKGFLKQLPDLKKQFATDDRPNFCVQCNEPSVQKMCRACQILEKIKKY